MKQETVEYDAPVYALIAVTKRFSCCYEDRYGMVSEELYDKYEKGQMQDSVELVDWANDYWHFLAIRLKIEKQFRHVA